MRCTGTLSRPCRAHSLNAVPQFDGVWYLALVNTKADDVAKANGSLYTFQQLHMLRQIVRAAGPYDQHLMPRQMS